MLMFIVKYFRTKTVISSPEPLGSHGELIV